MTQPLLLANLSRSEQIHQLTGGYGQLVIDRVADGWSPYLFVLKLRHLGHHRRRASVIAQMHHASEGAYTRLLFRAWKHRRARSIGKTPHAKAFSVSTKPGQSHSATGGPACCSFRMPMICSLLNRLFFIVRLLLDGP